MSRILFLSRWFPDPPNNGSKLRIYNLLRGLAAHHDVTLLTFHDPAEDPAAAPTLPQFCSHIEAIPWKPYNPTAMRARLAILSPRPRFVVDTFSHALDDALNRLLQTHTFDAVIASQIDMAVYSQAFRHLPSLFEEVEIATLYEQYAHAPTLSARLRYALTWFKHRRYLGRLLHNFDAATVVSDRERELLSTVIPTTQPLTVVPNGVDLSQYEDIHPTPQPQQLIFTGALTYDANYEAVIWFLQHVYPFVREQAPDVQLLITGNHGGRPLPSAAGVTLTGFVDDVRPLIAASAVSIAPILTGGGTRLKILEAMALGSPVVATAKGAEGLNATPDEHYLLADEPQQFARAIIHLLTNHADARHIAANARRLIAREYDWSAIMPHFLDLVKSVIMVKEPLTGVNHG